jgi:hypothetical protein
MATVEVGSKTSSDVSPHLAVTENRYIRCRLTMRLSDAGLRQRQTKALYPNHRLPPWLTEDATRDRSNRLLDGSADDGHCATFNGDTRGFLHEDLQSKRRPRVPRTCTAMAPMELGSETTWDVPARLALAEVLIHQASSNDEVERPRDHL